MRMHQVLQMGLFPDSVKPFPSSFGVYLITDGGKLRTEGRLEGILVDLVSSFSSIIGVQIRERLPDSEFEPATIEYLSRLCSVLKSSAVRADFIVTINSEVELVKETGADGVHLASRSVSPKEARDVLGSDCIIGYSAHSAEEVVKQEPHIIDYVYLSPIFQPGSKQYEGGVIGLDLLKEATSNSRVPVFALGGIRPEQVESLYHSGASGVSLISSVLKADDPVFVMSEFDNKINFLHKKF